MVLSEGPVLQAEDVFPRLRQPLPAMVSLAEARDIAEREHIRRVMARCGGKVAEAAQSLGVSRTTMWEKMKRLGIES